MPRNKPQRTRREMLKGSHIEEQRVAHFFTIQEAARVIKCKESFVAYFYSRGSFPSLTYQFNRLEQYVVLPKHVFIISLCEQLRDEGFKREELLAIAKAADRINLAWNLDLYWVEDKLLPVVAPKQRDPKQRDPKQRDPEQRDPEQRDPEQRDPEQREIEGAGSETAKGDYPGKFYQYLGRAITEHSKNNNNEFSESWNCFLCNTDKILNQINQEGKGIESWSARIEGTLLDSNYKTKEPGGRIVNLEYPSLLVPSWDYDYSSKQSKRILKEIEQLKKDAQEERLEANGLVRAKSIKKEYIQNDVSSRRPVDQVEYDLNRLKESKGLKENSYPLEEVKQKNGLIQSNGLSTAMELALPKWEHTEERSKYHHLTPETLDTENPNDSHYFKYNEKERRKAKAKEQQLKRKTQPNPQQPKPITQEDRRIKSVRVLPSGRTVLSL